LRPIEEILKTRYQAGSMANFYRIVPDQATEQTELQKSLRDFIRKFLSTIGELEKSPYSVNHPDVLYIKSSQGKAYTNQKREDDLDEDNNFEEFFTFMEYSPYSWKRRFVIIEDAHLIPENLSNKLLKLLEDPPTTSSIFFLDPFKGHYLATIQSRWIKLTVKASTVSKNEGLKKPVEIIKAKLEAKSPELYSALSSYIKGPESSYVLYNAIGKNLKTQELLVEALIEGVRNSKQSFQEKQEFLHELNWYQKSKAYNNPASERIMSLINASISAFI
jgi:hypothetical protein